jgi:hypothetical protein
VIAGAIAFNAKKERARFCRMLYAEVDKKARYAHLGNDLVAIFLEDGSDGKLEIVCGLVRAVIGMLQDAGTGEN